LSIVNQWWFGAVVGAFDVVLFAAGLCFTLWYIDRRQKRG
jgi:hypothetical protein